MNVYETVQTHSERLKALSRREVASVGPLLSLVQEMIEDAGRQYDTTCATVLNRVAERFLQRLEEAVDQDAWLSVRRAAAIVRRPEGTVRYWCRSGHVEARKVGADAWEIHRESLLRRAAA
jgi:hypothetical protein